MKKLFCLFLAFSVVGLSACGRSLDLSERESSVEASAAKSVAVEAAEIPNEKDYSYAHELATLYEKYNFGDRLSYDSPIFFVMGILKKAGLEEKYSQNGTFTMPYEDVKKLAALFFDQSLIAPEIDVEYGYGGKYYEIVLKPFDITEEGGSLVVTYGRFIEDDKNNLHWLFPAKYEFVPQEVSEADIPEDLKETLASQEMLYKLLSVTDIRNMTACKKLYSANGYGDLLTPKTYELKTAQDIMAMSQRVGTGLYNEINSNYTLCNDIDMGGFDFQPIGVKNTLIDPRDGRNPNHCGFNGSFDGGNHKISNLKCEVTTAEESMGEGVGFFGILDADAHITDLELNNADISNRGKICAGGTGILAGISYGGKIENCAVSGTVTGLRQVGGFIGSTSCGLRLNEEELRGSIKNCSAKAQVTAKEYSGVFIGENNSCIIESCGASGSITGEKLMGDDESCGVLGGFAGRNIAAEIIDSRCECFINTKAAGRCIGSFVGLNEGNIKNSVYRLDMSLWKPAGDTPRDDLITDIRGLSKEEYYKSAKK